MTIPFVTVVKYINEQGTFCPECGGQPVIKGNPQYSMVNHYVSQDIQCEDCGFEWMDIWRLTGIQVGEAEPQEVQVLTTDKEAMHKFCVSYLEETGYIKDLIEAVQLGQVGE